MLVVRGNEMSGWLVVLLRMIVDGHNHIIMYYMVCRKDKLFDRVS